MPTVAGIPNDFTATLDLAPRASMRAFGYLFGLHVALLVLVPFAMQPGPMMYVVLGLIAVSWLWLRRHPVFGFGDRAIVRLVWHAEGGWTLYDAAGRHSDATLLGSSYVHARLLVLNFRLKSGRRRTRILLGDELDAELLRKLRARLLVSGGLSPH
ncbi:MAG TPA: protein YgfX [Stenotrophobium sp.]|jgi:toxin CptA|nr:protein YgfX [Stenotrophobium sp.]